MARSLLSFVVVSVVWAKEPFKWPTEDLGQRTSEKVAAAKKAAKWIACSVCRTRVNALFAPNADEEQVHDVLQDNLGEWLGDAKKLCAMKPVAQLFREARVEIITNNEDGSAMTKRSEDGKKVPFYEEINTSELVFHWKSMALQHACMEVFRKSGDEVAQTLKAEYESLTKRVDIPQQTPIERIYVATEVGCRAAKFCKASDKLREKQRKTSEL